VSAKSNALFKFDLSTIASGRTATNVANATLTVFVSRVTKPGAISLRKIIGDWNEETIPAVTFTNLSGQIAVVAANAKKNYVRFDVTQLVKDWMSGAVANNGVAIGADASGLTLNIALDSKENSATGHPAKLEIEFIDQPAIAQSFKGAWSALTTYAAGDLVSIGGSAYVAVSANSNSLPANGNPAWSLLAGKGDKGDNGQNGSQGSVLQSFKNTWDSMTAYTGGDIVTSGGSTWIALAGNTNSMPASGNADWAALAMQGQKGDTGNPGPAGTVTPGSVTATEIGFLPSAQVTGNITQLLYRNSETPLQYNAEVFDPTNMHSIESQTSRLTVGSKGLYFAYVSENLQQPSGGVPPKATFSIWKNGAGTGTRVSPLTSQTSAVVFQSMIVLNAGDYVEVCANIGSNGGISQSDVGRYESSFHLVWLCPVP
jgi:hypothetical protein